MDCVFEGPTFSLFFCLFFLKTPPMMLVCKMPNATGQSTKKHDEGVGNEEVVNLVVQSLFNTDVKPMEEPGGTKQKPKMI